MEASGQGLDRTRGPGMDAKARCGLRPKAAGTVEWRCAGEGHAPIFLRMVTDCRVESALWSFLVQHRGDELASCHRSAGERQVERGVATGEVSELASVEPGNWMRFGGREQGRSWSRDAVGHAPLPGNKFPNAWVTRCTSNPWGDRQK